MSEWDKIVGSLIGAAFALRAADGSKSAPVRIGYGIVGYDVLSSVLAELKLRSPAAVGRVDLKQPKTQLKFQPATARTIAERVNFIHTQMLAGVKDPKIYALAREVLTRRCGNDWCVKEKDAVAEITAIFNEVRSKVRYTLDPQTFDAFATPG